MINRLIEWSLRNRVLVICGVLILVVFGVRAVYETPVDAIPDLSENQVVVFADWPGRSPQEVEDQVTYPLSVNLQGLAGVKTVRANSMFGFSLVTIIFDDKINNYFARSRVLERLNYLGSALPAGVTPQLGPDATGLGWVYQYYLDVDPKVARGQISSPSPLRGERAGVRGQSKNEAAPEPSVPPHPALSPNGGEGEEISGGYDLGRLRSIQDWFVRYQLNSVPGVAEVASVGGFVRQYQIEVSSLRMRDRGVMLQTVMDAVKQSNLNVGGKVIEENGMEFVVRGIGLVKSAKDLEDIVLQQNNGLPVYLRDVANVQLGGDFRRGALDIDGHEAVGGVVIMRTGENAMRVIRDVKAKIAQISPSLPAGVSIKSFYDRSELISRTLDTLKHALTEEAILVTVVIIIFLFHFRSILIVTLPLPLSILFSFILMNQFGITSNIMSLSGLAIAIGVLVDAGIVMAENAIRHCEQAENKKGSRLNKTESLQVTLAAAQQVGRPIFFAMVIIILAFVPVFALTGQEGKLFHPLAFTKTFAMLGSTILAVTLVPALCATFIRGPFHSEDKNPLMKILLAIYNPILDLALRFRKTVLALALIILAIALVLAFGVPRPVLLPLAKIFSPPPQVFSLINTGLQPGDNNATNPKTVSTVSAARAKTAEAVETNFSATDTRLKPGVNENLPADDTTALSRFASRYPRLAHLLGGMGSEFMPTLNEGSLLFMPVLLPSTSLTEIKRIIAWQDAIIKQTPEVASVGGKLGRSETATDPAPVEMIETTIMLKPESEWRAGMTKEKLIAGLEEKLGKMPGYVPGFLQPIENRILMISTGIRAQVGIKILGDNLDALQQKAFEVERVVRKIPGAVGVAASRVQGKPYLDIEADRTAMAHHGLRVQDILDVVESGIGGANISTVIQGRERIPIQVRIERGERDDIERIGDILVPVGDGKFIPLAQVAKIARAVGPSEIASENGRLRVFVQANIDGRDLAGFVKETQVAIAKEISLPPGMTIEWSGQYENQIRAQHTLLIIVPVALLVIFLLLYITFHSVLEAANVFAAVWFALSGGIFFQYLLGYNFSVAVWVGYIALFGTAIQTGVVMVIYLDEAVKKKMAECGEKFSRADLIQAVKDGARLRLRPKVMTVATIVAGLLPILWSHRTGAEVMKPLAAPVIGGMVSSLIGILIVTPVIFAWLRQREMQ